MTIRSRLAFWYAGLTLLALGCLAYGLYYELVAEPRQFAAQGKRIDTPKEEISEILLWYTLPAAAVAPPTRSSAERSSQPSGQTSAKTKGVRDGR